MNASTKLYFDRQRYRKENKITGSYLKLKMITNNKVNPDTEKEDDDTDENIVKRLKEIEGKLRPIGICLYSNKKYHILSDAMTWSVMMITDDLDYFEEETKDNLSGEKGKVRNRNCWNVLEEIQGDLSYQSFALMIPEITYENLNRV